MTPEKETGRWQATRETTLKSNHTPRPKKWQRVLRAFLTGRTLNRFEAATDLQDWCLHSTVSGLQRRNLVIHRRGESVPGAFGPVYCCRYALAPESFEKARELLRIAPRSDCTPEGC